MGYTTAIGLYIPDLNFLSILSIIFSSLLTLSSFTAISGETTPYSKFGNRKVDNVPSKQAMLYIYVPSVLVCLIFQFPTLDWSNQFNLIHFLTSVHFIKRVIEVLFVHIYKSKTDKETFIAVSVAYTITTLLDLLIVRQIPNNIYSKTLTNLGMSCFIVGEIVNAYHHWLLRKMRINKKDDGYHLPTGGLFDYALVPHYAAEQLTFIGLILISQNVVSLLLRSFPFTYLTIRAFKTREWYSTHLSDKNEKLELANRKNLIPFVW